ncbi:free fatty acid receptor 4-like [Dreissena polymorpha]|nr:free fatty acid receptor 4-like [Dreissena polymorpha]
MRTVTNCFVCNLAVADIAFCMSAPLVASVRVNENWAVGRGVCRLLVYSMNVCGTVMLWTMSAISIDRYMNINVGVASNRRLRKWQVVCICVLIWLASAICYLPFAMYFNIKEGTALRNETVTVCTLVWPRDQHLPVIFISLQFVLCCFIPVTIISLNYIRILKKYWKAKRAIESFASTNVRSDTRKESRVRKQQQVVRKLVLIVIVFVVMWSPMFAVIVLVEYDVTKGLNFIPSSALIWALIVAYCNSLVNAVIYGSIYVTIWNAFSGCFRRQENNVVAATIAVNNNPANPVTSVHPANVKH